MQNFSENRLYIYICEHHFDFFFSFDLFFQLLSLGINGTYESWDDLSFTLCIIYALNTHFSYFYLDLDPVYKF